MSRPRETGERHLFRSRLDQIINMSHELVRLAREIDWAHMEERGTVRPLGGEPVLPAPQWRRVLLPRVAVRPLVDDARAFRRSENRVAAWKARYLRLSGTRERKTAWHFCSRARRHQRRGEDKIVAPLQESLAVAVSLCRAIHQPPPALWGVRTGRQPSARRNRSQRASKGQLRAGSPTKWSNRRPTD